MKSSYLLRKLYNLFRKRKGLMWYVLLISFSFIPLFPILVSPEIPHTSDGEAHIIRFAVFYKELAQGQFPVRWAQQFHYGYGTAIFNFVSPMPYLFSVPLIFTKISLESIFELSLMGTYLLAGVSMLLFIRKTTNSYRLAFLGAIMYQFAPFRLVEMLTRGNLGSLYAYAFAPMLFYGLLRMKEKRTIASHFLIIFSVACLSLSHTIIGFAFILLSCGYLLGISVNFRHIIHAIISITLGLMVAAFFILPAVFEQKYTNGYLFTKDVFYGHFPPFHYLVLPNFFNHPSLRMAEVSVQIGIFHISGLLILTYFWISKKIQPELRKLVFFIITTSFLTIVFMNSLSTKLWESLSFIRQFQFPWRFIGILTFTTSLCAVLVVQSYKVHLRGWTYVLLVILIISSTAFYWVPTQGFVHRPHSFYWEYPKTTNYFSEVNTIWMAEEPTKTPEKRVEILDGEGSIMNLELSSVKHYFTVRADTKVRILDRTYFFPGWKVIVAGQNLDIQFQDPAYPGMITFELPKGTHFVEVQFGQSKIQQVGNMISASTLLLLLFSGVIALLSRDRKRNSSKGIIR